MRMYVSKAFVGAFVIVIMLLPGLSFLSPSVSDDGFVATNTASGSPGDDVGPMADTTAPAFLAYNRTPDYPGPTTIVNVSTAISDEDSNPTVKLQYGYDNATWTTKNATGGGPTETFTDRNPTSGYTQSRLTKTYSPGLEIFYLNVYIYNQDHDTCTLTVRGYVESTSTWETIYYQYRSSDGTKVNTHFVNKGYSRWDIDYSDHEGNDDSYYNCTYKVRDNVYSADIPAAGTQSKVYYRFNATDSATNWALSDTLNYTIDTTPLASPPLTSTGPSTITVPGPTRPCRTSRGLTQMPSSWAGCLHPIPTPRSGSA